MIVLRHITIQDRLSTRHYIERGLLGYFHGHRENFFVLGYKHLSLTDLSGSREVSRVLYRDCPINACR